jgi:hypothetical protein
VAEVPDERAHQRVELALEIGVGQVRDERERASAHLVEVLEEPCGGIGGSGVQHPGWVRCLP